MNENIRKVLEFIKTFIVFIAGIHVFAIACGKPVFAYRILCGDSRYTIGVDLSQRTLEYQGYSAVVPRDCQSSPIRVEHYYRFNGAGYRRRIDV